MNYIYLDMVIYRLWTSLFFTTTWLGMYHGPCQSLIVKLNYCLLYQHHEQHGQNWLYLQSCLPPFLRDILHLLNSEQSNLWLYLSYSKYMDIGNFICISILYFELQQLLYNGQFPNFKNNSTILITPTAHKTEAKHLRGAVNQQCERNKNQNFKKFAFSLYDANILYP